MPFLLQPRRLHVRKTIFVGSVLVLLFIYAYFIREPPGPANPVFRGHTMGTTYEVRIVGSSMAQSQVEALKEEIEQSLEEINQQMSTYEPESEISRFNRHRETAPFPVSAPFARVTATALELAAATDGAFDPTLDPLISLWGFGTEGIPAEPPTPEQIETARSACGFQHVKTDGAGAIEKDPGTVQLNLNAIAKGYGADVISTHLSRRGLIHSYVEIGGEVRVRGTNLQGTPWRIGIDIPDSTTAPGEQIAAILSLSDLAVATSGNYRNFYDDAQGVRRMHIIDPRTGVPATHATAGATVVAPTCMEADGIATALMVMEKEDALAWIEDRPDVEAMLIVRTLEGEFVSAHSSGFAQYLEKKFVGE
jgi:thiamine biosynthesis lipoprotein